MRVGRRAFLASMAASVAAPALLRRVLADAPRVTLKLHHYFSAVSGAHERFLAPWARRVEAESKGRIRIDLFPSMQLGGAPAQLFDQARDGVADIVWAAPSATPGRFPRIEAFELPFVSSHRALVNARAIEDFAAANLQDEFREVRPICFSCRDHGIVHTTRTIKSLEDIKGLRLHVPNRLAGEAVKALGAHGVSVPTPQVPMALSGHVIDGCLDPWDVVPGLRLNDTLRNHTDFAESALSTATFVLAMNKAAYERLPRELKTVIDNNAGQVAAGMAGAMWDIEARTVADTARDRGDAIAVLAAEEVAPWRRATEPVVVAWQKQMKEHKLDGGKLVADIGVLLAKYANEPEQQPQQAPQSPEASQPAEQKVGGEPPQPQQAKADVSIRPKADAPAAALPTPAPPTPAPSTTAAPAVQPVPAAATLRKELDIPL
jgi:TRAP-type transport system periplasmic protein